MTNQPTARVLVETTVPTEWGDFRCLAYETGNAEHIVLVRGDITRAAAPLVRMHSECFTGDVLGSQRCDCGPQLDESMARISAEGCGVVIYLRGHEGRGIGLVEKLKAYRLQDQGFDTVDANVELGFPVDARDYGDAAAILRDLGIVNLRLLSNNPKKLSALVDAGLTVQSVPLIVEVTDHGQAYLDTKRLRLGHALP